MKTIMRSIAVVLIAALAFTSVGFANIKQIEAKKNKKSLVNSVKVKGAKKKLTLKVGDKKTYKVVVKAKKNKTKFTVKSSNKKVLSVKKKGKKITLKALKKGKAKVTVRSKTNKNKKYVIKVTVKEKKANSVTMSVQMVSKSQVLVSFSGEIDINKLEASDFKVRIFVEDEDFDGKVSYEVDVYKIIKLNKSILVNIANHNTYHYEDHDIQVTAIVNGKKLVAECKTNIPGEATTYNREYQVFTGEDINISDWFGHHDEPAYGLEPFNISRKLGVPEGIEVFIGSPDPDSERIDKEVLAINGTISKAGTYNMIVELQDFMGYSYIYKIKLVATNRKNN